MVVPAWLTRCVPCPTHAFLIGDEMLDIFSGACATLGKAGDLTCGDGKSKALLTGESSRNLETERKDALGGTALEIKKTPCKL